MTIADMRVLLDLGDELSDLEVSAAYGAYLAAQQAGTEDLLVELADVKTWLRIDPAQTAEDFILDGLILAAQRAIAGALDRPIVGPLAALAPGEQDVIVQAMQMLIANWYRNRGANVIGQTVAELPLAVSWLLAPLRAWSL
jgi:hypothetical protein